MTFDGFVVETAFSYMKILKATFFKVDHYLIFCFFFIIVLLRNKFSFVIIKRKPILDVVFYILKYKKIKFTC